MKTFRSRKLNCDAISKPLVLIKILSLYKTILFFLEFLVFLKPVFHIFGRYPAGVLPTLPVFDSADVTFAHMLRLRCPIIDKMQVDKELLTVPLRRKLIKSIKARFKFWEKALCANRVQKVHILNKSSKLLLKNNNIISL